MKKVLALCLTLVMVIAMGVPTFAAPPNFVSSPSGTNGPELLEYSNADQNCTAKLVVTAYADRHTLDDATRAKLEQAYDEIVKASDVTALNAALAALAKDMNVDPAKLAVSDLFDISYTSCSEHDTHGVFTITIRPELLKNFVGILHLNGDNWELVSGAKAVNGNLTFTVDELSPFAIVVDTSAGSPITGDFSNIGFYVAAMAISASALVVIAFKLKKRETN